MPGREDDPIYIFGFIPVTDDSVASLESAYKGRAQHIAPTLRRRLSTQAFTIADRTGTRTDGGFSFAVLT